MSSVPDNAEEFFALIRKTTNTAQVDALLREMYQAKTAGKVTDDEEFRISRAAHDHRRQLKAAALHTKRSFRIEPASPQFSGRARTLGSLAPRISMHKVPPWIGGDRNVLSFEDAKRQFYLRRNVWLKQLRRFPLSGLAARVAMVIFEGLNGNPNNDRFGQCWLSLTTISAELQCRRASVADALKSLEAAGLLRIIHGRGRGNPNRYEPIIADIKSRDLEIPAPANS